MTREKEKANTTLFTICLQFFQILDRFDSNRVVAVRVCFNKYLVIHRSYSPAFIGAALVASFLE